MKQQGRLTVIWLASLCALIVLMIWIGGITRLTGSGLSIVDWNPIMGAIPPMNASDWEHAFERYRQFPQYQILNAPNSMSLAQFKLIFFWEYTHRLLGRLIGIVLIGPLLILGLRRQLDRPLACRMIIAFVLGGFQGLLGWYMVKSGLIDKPYVSHYRLAAHLLLALLLLAFMTWTLLDARAKRSGAQSKSAKSAKPAKWIVHGMLLLVLAQIFYGALTAGLKAGYAFNTFPTMNGSWLPPGGLSLDPLWSNFFDNASTVQFMHRLIGSTLVLWIALSYRSIRASRPSCARTLLVIVLLQFTLGVTTLLLGMPLAVASLHQLGATLLWMTIVWTEHEIF